jgi:hypothetical protein
LITSVSTRLVRFDASSVVSVSLARPLRDLLCMEFWSRILVGTPPWVFLLVLRIEDTVSCDFFFDNVFLTEEGAPESVHAHLGAKLSSSCCRRVAVVGDRHHRASLQQREVTTIWWIARGASQASRVVADFAADILLLL